MSTMARRGDAGTHAAALELDAVLRRLPVLEVYRANVFRITGVPTDASAAVARRRREEAELALRLGAPLPGAFGDLAPVPVPGAEALKDAFESMRNPVLRLVHELFWVWGEPGAHDAAVSAHCRALEAGRAADGLWREALAAWAAALADPGVWSRMERRARDIDDPRVTAATVARLGEAAPLRVLAVSAELAAAAAAAGDPGGASRHVALLEASPFDAALVARAVRDAVRGTEARLRDDADAALQAAAAQPGQADAAGRTLLERAAPRLQVVTLLLPRDPLTAALHDEISHTAIRCAVAHFNATGLAEQALVLLDGAAGLARERTTAEFCARNRRTIADAQVLAVVAPVQDTGNVDLAADILREWRRQCTDAGLRERLERLVGDPRAVRAPVEDAPSRAGCAGCGVRPFGRRAVADDETWVETRCVSLFGVPVFPLAAYLSDENFVYAKVPMSIWSRWAQLLVLAALIVLAAAMLLGLPGAAIAVGTLAAALGVATVRRRRQTRGWLAERTVL